MLFKSDRFRFISWLGMSVVMFFASYILATWPGAPDGGLFPRIQALLWKGALLNLAAHWIYWLARDKLGRLDLERTDDPIALALEKLAFAIMFVGGLIAWALVSQ